MTNPRVEKSRQVECTAEREAAFASVSSLCCGRKEKCRLRPLSLSSHSRKLIIVFKNLALFSVSYSSLWSSVVKLLFNFFTFFKINVGKDIAEYL